MTSKHADSLFIWCNKFENEKVTCRFMVSMCNKFKMRSKHADLLFVGCNKFENEKQTCRFIVSMV